MQKQKNFALIGVAGYIAVRHLKAIKETGNNMVASLDLFDSVGLIDHYFPNADFFTEFERFDRHIDKLRREDSKIDYVSICSPNYLHDSHIRFALRNDADAICEKPLVLNPWNVEALQEVEKRNNRKVYTILQLRLHPSIIALKKKVEESPEKIHDIDLSYITSRGKWYHFSWKGNVQKSGGIATNIGVHFFDMLIWIFGDVKKNVVHYSDSGKAAGYLELEKARVRWFLSIDANDLPEIALEKKQSTFRSIKINNQEIEFSDGFTDLHTVSYQNILEGKGFGLDQAVKSIETVHKIRNDKPIGIVSDYHPFCKKIKI
ncbi:MAG: Gfo/Idh/MocA family oxidoreductase [Bacteroidales bacterium]|nr:Gfo/Idh/MocA family oxidoreductase [Bacteroidales bacterium]